MWDEEDEEEMMILFDDVRCRGKHLYRKRWDCEHLMRLAQNEGSFIKEYRVTPQIFNLLIELLEPCLRRNFAMQQLALSESLSEPVSSASKIGATLIVLAGGRVMESMRTHGLAASCAYSYFHEVVNCINQIDTLKIECKNDLGSLQERAEAFSRLSSYPELFQFCTGAVDGLAITIRTPSRKEMLNTRRMYSGHKKKCCINVQAVCDADCKFIAISIMHAGSVNDSEAFSTCSLSELCSSQEFPFCWNGDNAYPLSETMMIPFPGVNLHIISPENESFNFYHSQLRITIERCFGQFIRRWGIFWKALEFSLKHCSQIIHACARLHNLCVTYRLPFVLNTQFDLINAAVNDEGVLVNDDYRDLDDEIVDQIQVPGQIRWGNSLRDYVVTEIKAKEIYRVRSHNRARMQLSEL